MYWILTIIYFIIFVAHNYEYPMGKYEFMYDARSTIQSDGLESNPNSYHIDEQHLGTA